MPYGSTSVVEVVGQGVVQKTPHNFKDPSLKQHAENAFSTESAILQRLGDHPRIVKFLGKSGAHPTALLLGEASHGDLQDYLDTHPAIDQSLAYKWCLHLTEALIHIHKLGVIHADMCPGNVFVHESTPGCLDLLLGDFGGSLCNDIKVDGEGLPSTPFYHPHFNNNVSKITDIFGLGSIMYTIYTGRWPYKDTPGRLKTTEERVTFEARVDQLLSQDVYPKDVDKLPAGSVIRKCWLRKYQSVDEVLGDLIAISA